MCANSQAGMLGRRITGGLLGSGVGLLLVSVALVWLPASGSAGGARAAKLNISRIQAVFSDPDRATTYSVVPEESDSNVKCCTYQWTLALQAVDPNVDVDGISVDADGDNHGVLTGTASTFVWHHGNKGDPNHDDGCNHDLQGKYGHQGLITLVVTDAAGWRCQTTYKGTLSSEAALTIGLDVNSEPVCTGPTATPPPPPPTPPPPPAKPCKCVQLTARILPSSLKLVSLKKSLITFVVHWVLTCSKGSGASCRGKLDFIDQVVKTPDGHRYEIGVDGAPGLPYPLDLPEVRCQSVCGGQQDGTSARPDEKLHILGGFDTRVRENLKGFPVVIAGRCQARRLAPIKLWIAFDIIGDIDLAKSKLQ